MAAATATAHNKRKRTTVHTLADFAERVTQRYERIEYAATSAPSADEFELLTRVLSLPNNVDAVIISDFQGSTEVLAELIQCLGKPSMQGLSMLSLYNCPVREPVFNAILSLLKDFSSMLYKVRLRRCSLPPRFTRKIFETLLEVEKIQLLEISENAIDERGVEALRELIAANTPLQTLLIGFMELGSSAIRELAQALKENTTLRSLSLSYNKVLNTGCEYLEEALRVNTTLETLYLKVAGISDSGASCLFRALEVNQSLQHLETKGHNGKAVDALRERLVQRAAKRKQTYLAASRRLSEKGGFWGRGKVMILGSSRAGKTATVRSLLNKRFKRDTRSTLGLTITQADVSQGSHEGWKLGPKGTYSSLYVHRNVASVVRNQNAVDLSSSERQRAKRASKFSLMTKLLHARPSPAERGTISSGQAEAADETVYEAMYKESLFIKYTPADMLRVSIWDYSSEGLLKTLHQLFITRHGVYLVVISLKDLVSARSGVVPKVLDTVMFWLNAIKLHAPKAPFLIVGTHYDHLDHPAEQLQTVEAALHDAIRGNFPNLVQDGSRKFWPIDNKSGFSVPRLTAAVEAAVRGEDYVNMCIPLRWVQALDALLRTGETWLTLDAAFAICAQLNVDEPETVQLLTLAHELGILLYFTGTEKLKQVVTLHPKWLVIEMSKVIGYYTIHRYAEADFERVGLKPELKDLLQRAIVSRDLLNHLWGTKHTEFLLDLTRSLLLMSSWHFENRTETYLVPNLISHKQTVNFDMGRATNSFRFAFGYLPFGVFERLVCVIVDYSSKQDNVPAPLLSKDVCVTWLGPDYPVQIRKEPETQSIVYTIQSHNDGVHCLEFVSLATRKIKNDLKWDAFHWEIFIQNGAEYVAIEEAKKLELAPWFSQGKREPAANVNAFLSSF